MKTLLKRVYLAYCGFWFVFTFLLIFPGLYLATLRKSWHPYSMIPYRAWARFFFPLCFLPFRKVFRFRPNPRKSYVYVANHSTYLDIPVLTNTLPGFFAYMGKKSLEKVPLFGYTFKKLHITVDRKNRRDRYRAYRDSIRFLRNGRSLVMFPEGGIDERGQPTVHPFKEGAFKIALAEGVPIVPVTLSYNWYILPLEAGGIAQWHPVKVVIHEPLATEGLSDKDLPALKDRAYRIIHQQLMADNEDLKNTPGQWRRKLEDPPVFED